MKTVAVVSYQPDWLRAFAKLRDVLAEGLAVVSINVERTGVTVSLSQPNPYESPAFVFGSRKNVPKMVLGFVAKSLGGLILLFGVLCLSYAQYVLLRVDLGVGIVLCLIGHWLICLDRRLPSMPQRSANDET